MTMRRKYKNNLLKPGQAVEDYFDNLLQQPVAQLENIKPVQFASNVLILSEPEGKHCNDLSIDLSNTEQVLADSEKQQLLEKEQLDRVQDLELQRVDLKPLLTKQENFYYDFPIQCLMFNVAGNLLSIPMIDLSSVAPWDDNLTQLPEMPDCFLGLFKHRDSNVTVVDTAKLMHIDAAFEQVSNRHILVLADKQWALTCDQLGGVVELNKEDVQWPNRQGKRLILGTIRQPLTSLLDPVEILNQLNNHREHTLS